MSLMQMARTAAAVERYPKYKALYLKAFEKLLEQLDDKSKITSWDTAEDVMNWWVQ